MFDYFTATLASLSPWNNQVTHKEHNFWPLNTTITFEPAPEQNSPEMTRCSVKWLIESCRNGITRCVNTFALMHHGFNLHKMQVSNTPEDFIFIRKQYLLNIPTFNFSTHPAVTAAIFKCHRESEFFTLDNGPDTIFAYISDMLNIKNLNPDEIIFTCSPEKTDFFKEHLKNLLTPKAIEEYSSEIYDAVSSVLRIWERDSHKTNVTHKALPIVCDIMSRILLGKSDSDAKLTEAMRTFFDYVEARFPRKKFDASKLQEARSDFFQIVEDSIKAKKGIAGALAERCLENRAITLIIFSLCFAGIDSTAQSTIYTFHKLAQSKSLQTALREEISKLEPQNDEPHYNCASKSKLAQQIMMESLRMFCPVIGVTRISKEIFINADFEEKQGAIRIPKGEHIAPSQNLIARCPMLFPENPDQFIPERHENLKPIMSLSWCPFGGVKNGCPGWPIYKKLMEIILFETSQRYTLYADIDYEIEQTGSFINKLKKDVIIAVMPVD